METYGEDEGIMSQRRKLLISSFLLQHGTLMTPLLLFYLQLGFVCRKLHRFVEYTLKKCFNSFVQSAVDAKGQVDENPSSSVVAEATKVLVNSSYGCQITDRCRQTLTKYVSDKQTHVAINISIVNSLRS